VRTMPLNLKTIGLALSFLFLFAILIAPSSVHASVVLSQNVQTGNAATAYDFPQYGGGQYFTATSSYTIGSVEFYTAFNNATHAGCARAHVYSTLAGVPDVELAQSSECVSGTSFTISPTFATTTWSFPNVSIVSGTSYVISVEWEGTLPPAPDYFLMRHAGISGGLGNRCGLFASWSCATPNSSYTFRAFDTGGFDPDVTRIDTVTPYDGEVSATSTSFTFAVTGYFAEADWYDGSTVTVHYENAYRASQNIVGVYASQLALTESSGDFEFPVTAFGTFSFSTTTNLQQVGKYNLTAEATSPSFVVFGVNFGTSVVVATSTSFLVATTTPFDDLTSDVQDNVINFSASACAFANFEVFGCLSYLLLPTRGDMNVLFNEMYDVFFTQFPFGYVTRFVEIINFNVDPVQPPPIDYTFGSSSPVVLQGVNVEIQIWDNMEKLQEIVADDGTNKNIFDIVDPYITVLVGLAVVMVIVGDLLALDFGDHISPSGRMKGEGVESYIRRKTTKNNRLTFKEQRKLKASYKKSIGTKSGDYDVTHDKLVR